MLVRVSNLRAKQRLACNHMFRMARALLHALLGRAGSSRYRAVSVGFGTEAWVTLRKS
jgi:hypothetical protein